MVNKIGFACMYYHDKRNHTTSTLKQIESQYNTNTTTIAWLNRQSTKVAEEKLLSIAFGNAEKAYKLINYVSNLPDALRFLRLSSDQCPAYTHHQWKYFYKQKSVSDELERLWKRNGELARLNNIRLSFHPGQFCVLASDNPDVVTNSIQEFEYHCDMIRWMGYGKEFQDFKCNVHIGGRLGPDGIRAVYPLLSTEARNTITIENDEFGWGLDSCLELADIIPIVLDIHHHYIRTGGEYIQSSDTRIKQILDSWRGIRPVIHYSVSREEYARDNMALPDMQMLLTEGHKPQSLRAHSDMFNNVACNDWALSFWNDFDIMCESKCKNLSSNQLYQQFLINNNVN
jgi:UV DNA damage endonuclease